MKLIRWLLSNIILIAFVLALTYAYVYWDNLTGEDTPAGKVIAYLSVEYDEVREFLDSYEFEGGDQAVDTLPPDPAVTDMETASVPQVTPPPGPQVRTPVQQQQPMPAQSRPQPVPPQAMMQQLPMQPQPMMQQQSAPPQAMMQQPAPRQQPVRPSMPPRTMTQEPPAMPQMQPPPMPATTDRTTASDTPAKSTRELWISAREEYHRGNLEGSIRNYQQVIANSTDNYDAYGEMGNVYLRKGSPREAASAYFEAAAILVKMGQIRRASSLMPMLQRLDRAKAEELNQLLSQSTSS